MREQTNDTTGAEPDAAPPTLSFAKETEAEEAKEQKAAEVERSVARLSGSHYRLIKQIVTELVSPPDGALQRTGLVRAIGRSDRHVEWVLGEDVERFEREGRACLHPQYNESIGRS